MTSLGSRATRATLITAFLLVGRDARAVDPPDPATMDRKALGGCGTDVNFRGIGHELDADGTIAAAPESTAVEALRFGGRAVLLPAPMLSTTWWALAGGVRTAVLHFDKGANQYDPTQGGFALANVEPTLGLVVEDPADTLRFEVDVAPVLSAGTSSRLASQAALTAALATAPHDDLLFLPNLHSAGRLRASLARRWDMYPWLSFGLRAEIEAGYAQTETVYGTAQGSTGGGEVRARLYFRPRLVQLEGVYVEGIGDVGYTSAWSSDVVLPVRAGFGVGAAINRTVEVWFAFSRFGASVVLPNAGLDSSAGTLGIRLSFDRWSPEWTRRHVEVQPDLVSPEMLR